jgi:hypothetical protein
VIAVRYEMNFKYNSHLFLSSEVPTYRAQNRKEKKKNRKIVLMSSQSSGKITEKWT